MLVAGAAVVLGALAAAMHMRQRWRYKGRQRVGQEDPAEMEKMGSEDAGGDEEGGDEDSDNDSMVIAESAKPAKQPKRKGSKPMKEGALARVLRAGSESEL